MAIDPDVSEYSCGKTKRGIIQVLRIKNTCSIVSTIGLTGIISLMYFMASCKTNITSVESEQQLLPKTAITDIALERNDEYYLKIGFDLMNNDAVGPLNLGLTDTEAISLLGVPEEKSKAVVWGADGEEHQTWHYKGKGIKMDMIGPRNRQVINSITTGSPCTLKTKRNIGIGSTKEDVLKAYKEEIDLSEIHPDTDAEPAVIIAGTVYGGIGLEIKNNLVSSIFIGAGAE